MKKTKLIPALAFLLVIGFLSVGGWLAEDREFSENENRYLAEKPKFSIDNFMSGKFQEKLESYLNDQMLLRDQWITIKTAVQKACRDTDIGGAYVGKNGYDFEKILPEDVDERLFARNTQAVKDFFESCSGDMDPTRLSFLLVPTSGLVLKEELPDHAILFDQEGCISQVKEAVDDCNFIDVRDILKAHTNREIYYRTDHHWTTDGAFLAYEEWCRATGHEFLGEDAYEKTVVTDSFRGSLYSKILDYDSAYDRIWTLDRKGSAAVFRVTADGTELSGFYQPQKLQEKDKYAYFFGGNYGEVQICQESSGGGKGNLLLIKDSFANAFVPLIAEEYDNIYMIDLRYYKGDLAEYRKEHSITDVLVLYNISNFISDKNLYQLSNP